MRRINWPVFLFLIVVAFFWGSLIFYFPNFFLWYLFLSTLALLVGVLAWVILESKRRRSWER